ncbi:thioredoxin family protein [Virgibacillus halophilus]|uniref:Thioredoxin family protein n=1 Tax=Tigheibacillus halophilus TaxID=361280 RepID=A0ABU5C219_9BACI|nr:thioredoxin family protein [Virgibacillus halophilus]
MRHLEQLNTLEKIDSFIAENQMSFIYITQPNCSVCHGLLPQIQELMERYPKIKLGKVDAASVPAIAGKFSVFTVPVLILFIEGKEYLREARIVHLDLLEEKLNRVYENVAE